MFPAIFSWLSCSVFVVNMVNHDIDINIKYYLYLYLDNNALGKSSYASVARLAPAFVGTKRKPAALPS